MNLTRESFGMERKITWLNNKHYIAKEIIPRDYNIFSESCDEVRLITNILNLKSFPINDLYDMKLSNETITHQNMKKYLFILEDKRYLTCEKIAKVGLPGAHNIFTLTELGIQELNNCLSNSKSPCCINGRLSYNS